MQDEKPTFRAEPLQSTIRVSGLGRVCGTGVSTPVRVKRGPATPSAWGQDMRQPL